MSKKNLAIYLIVVSTFGASSAYATSEEEKAELNNVLKELIFLKARVEEISKLQREDDTEKVNYPVLIGDMKLMSDGLKRHLNSPSRVPRTIRPLEAEYGSVR